MTERITMKPGGRMWSGKKPLKFDAYQDEGADQGVTLSLRDLMFS